MQLPDVKSHVEKHNVTSDFDCLPVQRTSAICVDIDSSIEKIFESYESSFRFVPFFFIACMLHDTSQMDYTLTMVLSCGNACLLFIPFKYRHMSRVISEALKRLGRPFTSHYDLRNHFTIARNWRCCVVHAVSARVSIGQQTPQAPQEPPNSIGRRPRQYTNHYLTLSIRAWLFPLPKSSRVDLISCRES